MDFLLFIYFSTKIYRLAGVKKESQFGWVFRYISLSIGFELFLYYCFSCFVQPTELVDKILSSQQPLPKDLGALLVFGLLSWTMLFVVYYFLRKSLLSINNNDFDSPIDKDDLTPPTPPKDLSYFR